MGTSNIVWGTLIGLSVCVAPLFAKYGEDVLGMRLIWCVLFWGGFYILTARVLQSFPSMRAPLEGYPAWSSYIGIIHCCIVLPIIFTCAMIATGGLEGPVTGLYSFMTDNMWIKPWDTTWESFFFLNIYACILGYFVKDFIVLEEDLDLAMCVHHLVSTWSVNVYLFCPLLAGMGAFCAFTLEVASGFYNLAICMRRRQPYKVLYEVTMVGSNLHAVFLAWVAFRIEGLPMWFCNIQAVLCFLLVAIRFGGLVLSWMENPAEENDVHGAPMDRAIEEGDLKAILTIDKKRGGVAPSDEDPKSPLLG